MRMLQKYSLYICSMPSERIRRFDWKPIIPLSYLDGHQLRNEAWNGTLAVNVDV